MLGGARPRLISRAEAIFACSHDLPCLSPLAISRSRSGAAVLPHRLDDPASMAACACQLGEGRPHAQGGHMRLML